MNLDVGVKKLGRRLPGGVEAFVKGPERLHVLLRHRLPPFLGETLGGSTGRVDVGVTRYPQDLALHPLEHL